MSYQLIISGVLSLIAIFFLGANIGSFTAVAVERIPKGLSINSPSTCACGRPLKFYENIPIIGYLRIRGRAKCCGAKLPLYYLTFEIIGGLISVALALVAYFVWLA